jgi:archaellum component FlaC
VINHIITSDGNVEVTGTEGFWLPLFQYKLSFLRLLTLAISESHEAADISSVAWQPGTVILEYTDGSGAHTLNVTADPGLTVVFVKNGAVSITTAGFNEPLVIDGCPIAVRVDFSALPYPGPVWPVVMPEWTKGIPNSDDVDAIESSITALADALSDAEAVVAAYDARITANETDISGIDADITALQSTVSSIVSELNTFGASLTSLTSSVTSLVSDISGLGQRVNVLELDLAALAARVSVLEGFHP